MVDGPKFTRSLFRRAENTELSLGSLEAISEIREHLDELERASMVSAREKGATVEDIASALRLTPQAIYYRFRNERVDLQTTPGQPSASEATPGPVAGLDPEAALAPSDPSNQMDDSVLGPDLTLGS